MSYRESSNFVVFPGGSINSFLPKKDLLLPKYHLFTSEQSYFSNKSHKSAVRLFNGQ